MIESREIPLILVIVYDAVRNEEVVPAPDPFLPWDVAEVTALVAAEEYRVHALAHVMAQAVFNPTAANGERIEIASILGPCVPTRSVGHSEVGPCVPIGSTRTSEPQELGEARRAIELQSQVSNVK